MHNCDLRYLELTTGQLNLSNMVQKKSDQIHTTEIRSRILIATSVIEELKTIWKDKEIIKSNIHVFLMTVISTVLYESET